jgi:hypothetical protein
MMRKVMVMLAILPLLVFNCKKNESEKNKISDNILLAREVTVISPVLIDNRENPEWTASFHKKAFFDTLFNRALTKRITVYGGTADLFEDIELHPLEPMEGIVRKTKPTTDGGILKSLNEILFYEKWNFDREYLKMSKEVLGWSPINNWTENGEDKRQWVFFVYPKLQTKGKKIAENIFYEVPLYFEGAERTVGFDKKAFFKSIIEGIKSNKIFAYDPIYLVDKSKRKFTPENLAKYIEQQLNPSLINSTLKSILFEEDWYFDENTLSIQKDVKSIAFVQWTEPKKEGDPNNKILFFIFPKN